MDVDNIVIDWKYGFYRVLWWIDFIISISIFFLTEPNWTVSITTMLIAALAFMGCLSIFEKKHSYFQEKTPKQQ
ncbi:hypothetical protein [Tetragenococcus muriaticus]|uniref:Integral membrane protein n=2 Tax=Tetragenococcus muriaticus TaxID=64642 RepID=A0A091CBS2_9ENTE|nr:hypothetical protein [Tetragenococcus muriaticus]KFN89078.1 hypothetical protein TMU3MR103_2242 [Tetragenococcus muriaticus 3MR10-3]KFN89681.1 hypothetical protein TMUPMC115_2306 [Tetragenococcus muriaticus PMC-11-5]